MLTIPLLLLFLATPAIFWIYGKRLLGSQTHPAALFILSWMASALLLDAVNFSTIPAGPSALLWVALNFAGFALVAKIRGKSGAGSAPTEVKSKDQQ